MTTIYSNNFESDAVGSLPTGWANKTGTWVIGTTNPVSAPNTLGSTTNGDGDVVLYTGSSAVADMQLDTKQKQGSGGPAFPLMSHILRSDSGNNNHYAIIFSAGTSTGGKVLLFKKISGSYSQIGSDHAVSLAQALNDVIYMRTKIVGNTISIYLGNGSIPGSPTLTITDSSITAAGYPGLYNSKDGVAVTMKIDDFVFDDASGAASVPGAPTIGTATAGDTTASVAFTAPGSDGGSAIIGYTATSTPGSITGSAASSPITVSGLTNGTAYTFTVHATNAVGNSTESAASNSVTPASTAATAITMSGPSSGSVGAASSNFTIGANGTITGTVTVTPSSGGSGGTFTPTSVAISSGAPTATFTYTAASAGAKTISVTNNGGLTNPSNITYTASTGPVVVPVTDANWKFSPYNWDTSAGKKIAVNGSAYFKLGFTGTSVTIGLDVSSLVAGGVPSSWYPSLRYSVDGGPQTDIQLTPTTTALTISGLAAGSHRISVWYLSGWWENIGGTAPDRWTTPVYCVKVTGATIDAGAATAAPVWLDKNMLWGGDSISEGIRANYSDVQPGCQNAYESAPMYLAASLGCELGNVSFGGQNYGGGFNSVPAFNTSYSSYYNGRTRLVGGLFSPAPDYIALWFGANGNPTTGEVNTSMVNMRAAAPAARIFVVVPVGGTGRANITSAVAAYLSAHPAETGVHLIDLGTAWQVGLTGFGNATEQAIDNLHPRSNWNARIASAMAVKMQALIDGASPPALTSRSVSITLADTAGPLADLTGLKVAFYDEATPDLYTVPRYQSGSAVTDGSGVLTFSVNTTLTSGGIGSIEVRAADGRHFNGAVAVS